MLFRKFFGSSTPATDFKKSEYKEPDCIIYLDIETLKKKNKNLYDKLFEVKWLTDHKREPTLLEEMEKGDRLQRLYEYCKKANTVLLLDNIGLPKGCSDEKSFEKFLLTHFKGDIKALNAYLIQFYNFERLHMDILRSDKAPLHFKDIPVPKDCFPKDSTNEKMLAESFKKIDAFLNKVFNKNQKALLLNHYDQGVINNASSLLRLQLSMLGFRATDIRAIINIVPNDKNAEINIVGDAECKYIAQTFVDKPTEEDKHILPGVLRSHFKFSDSYNTQLVRFGMNSEQIAGLLVLGKLDDEKAKEVCFMKEGLSLINEFDKPLQGTDYAAQAWAKRLKPKIIQLMTEALNTTINHSSLENIRNIAQSLRSSEYRTAYNEFQKNLNALENDWNQSVIQMNPLISALDQTNTSLMDNVFKIQQFSTSIIQKIQNLKVGFPEKFQEDSVISIRANIKDLENLILEFTPKSTVPVMLSSYPGRDENNLRP